MAHRVMPALLLLLASMARAEPADPTRPPPGFSAPPAPETAAAPPAPLVVTGVFLIGARPWALLDGQVVRPGDRLPAGRVTGIDEGGVWLGLPDGGKRRLRLIGVDKRPAGSMDKVEKQ